MKVFAAEDIVVGIVDLYLEVMNIGVGIAGKTLAASVLVTGMELGVKHPEYVLAIINNLTDKRQAGDDLIAHILSFFPIEGSALS